MMMETDGLCSLHLDIEIRRCTKICQGSLPINRAPEFDDADVYPSPVLHRIYSLSKPIAVPSGHIFCVEFNR
jgi:hypothetical protein